MHTKIIAPLTTLALSSALLVGVAAPSNAAGAAPAAVPAAAVAPAAQATTQPVQIVQDNINGVFTLTNFIVQNGQLVAVGTFTGDVTTATGVQHLTNAIVSSAITTAQAQNSCSILDLTLGPLHLDLLGLVIDLNQVHLTITAQQGPGNLLGNLLCSVANLLNNGTGLNGVATLLNRILGLLG